MKVQYLEIITHNVDATCESYSTLHNVIFSDCEPSLGGARTANLSNGGVIGIRAPLREDETPVTRPYFLVENIQEAVEKSAADGAEIAVLPMVLPGHGTCAIIIQGGIESGFWQL